MSPTRRRYVLQIDDSSTFVAPLVSQQTVVVSQASVGGLPAAQLWWRVRGVNSAGVAGDWSAVRSVRPAGGSSTPLPAPGLVSPADDARFPPGQTVRFDWADVAGAANYTIQIDDSQSFSNPLTFTQTVTASEITISTLPTTRMWWRVRANSGSGTAGNWSSSRRFELKR